MTILQILWWLVAGYAYLGLCFTAPLWVAMRREYRRNGSAVIGPGLVRMLTGPWWARWSLFLAMVSTWPVPVYLYVRSRKSHA